MRVVVPAVPDKLHQRVVPAILEQWPTVEVVNVAGPLGYFQLFTDLWRDGVDFTLIEHDIELHAGVLDGFEACTEAWCSHSYPVYWGDVMTQFGVPGLGCTRFRAELMEAHPELPDMILATDLGAGDGPGHWMQLDGAVAQWLRGPWGHVAHRHQPNVLHHHHYVYEGAYLPDEIRATLAPDHPLALSPDTV